MGYSNSRMLVLATAASIPFWIQGCKGGGSSSSTVPPGGDPPLGDSDHTSGPAIAVDVSNVLRIRSASGDELASHPVQFGRPFVAGEIKGCPQVLIDGTPASLAQVDVKTRHPDGSVRFAVISAMADVTAAGVAITFADGTCPSPRAPLTAEQMLAPQFDFDARIVLNGDAADSVSARDMISAGNYTLWTNGPVVTTAIIADHQGKSFDIGVDDYKSLRPVFEVQFWNQISKVRVRVILEAVDTEKVQSQTYDVSVSVGKAAPTQVLSATGVQHNYMSRWTRVFWIGGAPPDVDFDYGLAYLTKTRALPNYDATIELSQTSKNDLINAWASAPKGLYDSGLWDIAMPDTGGRPDLCPYPRWMVAWLYEGSAALKNVALGMADLAAAWPMHLREGNPSKFADRDRTLPALGLPVSGYARPTLAYQYTDYGDTEVADRVTIVVPPSSNGWVPDNAHQPQPFFIPYLLTGEHFYNEQMEFWAGFSLLDLPWGLYGFHCSSKNVTPQYLGVGGELRGTAWALRMLAEAAWAAPDQTNAHTWINTAVEDVITRFEGSRGVVRGDNTSRPDWQWASKGGTYDDGSGGDCSNGELARNNPMRYWAWLQLQPGQGYDPTPSASGRDAPWMYGFMMYALNRAYELGHPAGALRAWFAPFFINAALYCAPVPYHLADYTLPVIAASTGTFFQSWAAVSEIPEYDDYTNGDNWSLNAGYADGNSTNGLDQGYASVALCALASTGGLPGSADAWNGLIAANYAVWGWNADPKWAILPRDMATTTPAACMPLP